MCEIVMSLIVFGGVGLGVAAGVGSEALLDQVGYRPRNYLAEWRERLAARRAEATAEPA